MIKGLEILQEIKSKPFSWEKLKDNLDIIEKELKRLAVYETFGLINEKYDDVDKLTDIKGKLTYVDKVMDTQERLLTSVSSDEIKILSSVLNSQITNLKKKLKALSTIVQIFDIKVEKNKLGQCFVSSTNNLFAISQETYDLLKEVLL